MHDPQALSSFYEQAYTSAPEQAELYSRWRALGAVGKADHVIELCARAGLRPNTVLDVGCGDGALLDELSRRGFGGTLTGLELSAAAVAIARARPGIERVEQFDGAHVPAGERRVRPRCPLTRARARTRPAGACWRRWPGPAGRS